MKVSRLLAHRIHSEIQIAIGMIDQNRGQRAIMTLEKLSRLVENQTVEVVDNCESCGFKRVTLNEKTRDDLA